MTLPVQLEQLALAKDGSVWRTDHFFSLGSSASMYFGLVTGAREIVLMSREYFSTSTNISADLFETSFTDGTNMRTINRRLALKDGIPPVQFKHSVTPGVLGSSITGFISISSGPNRVGKQGEDEPLIFEENTSYIIRLTNNGAGTEQFSAAFDYRERQPGEF